MRKIWFLILVVWGLVGYFAWNFAKEQNIDLISHITNPIVDTRAHLKSQSVFQGDVLNVLVVGTDTSSSRRADGQGGFNTDTMILISLNPATNKVLFTSVPRDLWINGNKINALYTVFGEEVLVDAFEQISGLQVDGVVRADFDSFEWVIDAFGGVPVNVETSFTDSSFPSRDDSRTITVNFSQGPEVMDGARALVFARSRKGTNGEGSDLMRAKRQHLILQGLVEAISQPASKFQPMNIDNFYQAATSIGDIYTTLTLTDAKYLWDFYKDKDLYTVESFVIGDEYIYHPTEGYIAWVFIPRDPTFGTLHTDIANKLNPQPENVQSAPDPVL